MSWHFLGQRCNAFERLPRFHFRPIRLEFGTMQLSPVPNAPNGAATRSGVVSGAAGRTSVFGCFEVTSPIRLFDLHMRRLKR